jgi:hypothetical protein
MKNDTATPMKNLLEDIRTASGVDEMKAELAVGAMLGFLSARLPSPVMGRIKEALSINYDGRDVGNAAK